MTDEQPITSQIFNFMLKRNTLIMGVVIGLTLVFSFFAVQLQVGSSGFSYESIDQDSLEEYQAFKKKFGSDETVFILIQNRRPVTDQSIQDALAKTGEELRMLGPVKQVVDLSLFDVPKLTAILGINHFWQDKSLARLKILLPGINSLISKDLKTLTIAVEFKNNKQNGFLFAKQLNEIQSLIQDNFPDMPFCRFIGVPVLKSAFERYNAKNTMTYVLMGWLIGALATLYIFKSLKVSFIVTLSSACANIWTAGLIVLLGMELTIMSGISACFVIIVATTTIIHIVSKHYELILQSKDHLIALKKTLSIVLRPCFMCALTTSIGFASLMISPVRMVQETGLIISIGVLTSFGISLVVSVFILIRLLPPKPIVFKKIETDLMTRFLKTRLSDGLNHPKMSLLIGFILTVILIVGTGFVKTSKHPVFQVSKKTIEARNIEFAQKELKMGYPVSILITPTDKDETSSQLWRHLFEFEQKVKTLDFIQRVDSIIPLLTYLSNKMAPFSTISQKVVIERLMANETTQKFIRSFINLEDHQIRIVCHVSALTTPDVSQMMAAIEKQAQAVFKTSADISFQGLLILEEKQKKKILNAQIRSMILALGLITFLMIIQLRSFGLGMISLIPNAMPLLTMFGLMGIFNIPLDPLIIFSAIISFGLSVDDSIHFLTQLKREISKTGRRVDIRHCIRTSYKVTSRSLLSTTSVLFFSSLSFLFSSFDHVFSIGLLIASSSVTALYADLVLLNALIIKSKFLQNSIKFS